MKYARIEWPALVDVSEERMGRTVIYRGRGEHELDGRDDISEAYIRRAPSSQNFTSVLMYDNFYGRTRV